MSKDLGTTVMEFGDVVSACGSSLSPVMSSSPSMSSTPTAHLLLEGWEGPDPNEAPIDYERSGANPAALEALLRAPRSS